METKLSRQSFDAICGRLFENFRRRIDVYGLRLKDYSMEFLSELNDLWCRHVHPDEPPSLPVTIAALRAMRALQTKYATSSIGDYQHELRQLERDAESLGDSFAEKFNHADAVPFEIDLKKLAEAARRQGYDASNVVRGLRTFSERLWFESALSLAGFQVERDTPLYEALHDFFRPHFKAGFDEPLPPDLVARLETNGKERDPSVN